MSQYIDTQQTPYGGSTGLSTRQRWEIAVGIIIAAALAVAAFAYVNRTESPVVEQVAQPVAQSYAAGDDLATRFTVSEAIRFAGADDLATRSSAVGASGIVEQSILDALEERSGAGSSAVGTSVVVAQSALDPFDERVGSPEVRAATGTTSASPKEITRSPNDSAVGYFDRRWHGVGDPTDSAESLSQPSVAYFDGQWHIGEASNKHPTLEFRQPLRTSPFDRPW